MENIHKFLHYFSAGIHQMFCITRPFAVIKHFLLNIFLQNPMKEIIMNRNIFKTAGKLFLLSILSFSLGHTLAYAVDTYMGDSIPTSAEGNWGLSFQEEGKTPVGNATADELKKYDAYFTGDTSEKVIYLTFDAGYENGNTAPILDALKKHQVPAAFFCVGNFISENPDLIKRMVDEGHIVGNHTFSHPDMSKISTTETFSQELAKVEDLYKNITGTDMVKFYRPPQGKYSESNLQMAKAMGYHTFFWSLAYVDWYQNQQPTKEEAFSKLLTRIHPGAIVLLHSTSSTNAAIMDELLTKWKEMGYSFRSLTDLAAEK